MTSDAVMTSWKRKDARRVRQALLGKNLVDPRLIRPKAEVRRPVPLRSNAGNIGNHGKGTPDVLPKRFRIQNRKLVVPITVRGDFVTRAVQTPDPFRIPLRCSP